MDSDADLRSSMRLAYVGDSNYDDSAAKFREFDRLFPKGTPNEVIYDALDVSARLALRQIVEKPAAGYNVRDAGGKPRDPFLERDLRTLAKLEAKS